MTSAPLLSICIQTFNRRELVMDLVRAILCSEEDIEVIVYIDGSTDGTKETLESLTDDRLFVLYGPNRGKAWGVYRSVSEARGQYAMIFDDDDLLDAKGVGVIACCLKQELPEGVCGHIFHFNDKGGERVGSPFPAGRSNFLKLRADEGVTGDKKEVVRTAVFKGALFEPPAGVRRMPMSVVWSCIALRYDVLCHDSVVATKHYLPGGTTEKVRRIRWAEPRLMARLHRQWIIGFAHGRYRSWAAFGRSVVGSASFGAAHLYREGKRRLARAAS